MHSLLCKSIRAADAIEKRCLEKMIEYEKNAGMPIKKRGGAKYTGLGGRIRAYEKHLKENPACGGESIINKLHIISIQ